MAFSLAGGPLTFVVLGPPTPVELCRLGLLSLYASASPDIASVEAGLLEGYR